MLRIARFTLESSNYKWQQLIGDMKMKITAETLKTFNKDSSHYTVGLNTFSLWSTVMLWAHFAGHFTWWALPVTVIMGLIGFGNEIQERKSNKNTITFK